MFAKDHNCSDELRDVNLKSTPARLIALQHFEKLSKPTDSKDILKFLNSKLNIDRVTVFRILNSFVEKGLVRKIDFGEGKARYELNVADHHHLICQSCGSIEDISDCNIDALEREIKQNKHFLVNSHSLEFFGICPDCQPRLNRGQKKKN